MKCDDVKPHLQPTVFGPPQHSHDPTPHSHLNTPSPVRVRLVLHVYTEHSFEGLTKMTQFIALLNPPGALVTETVITSMRGIDAPSSPRMNLDKASLEKFKESLSVRLAVFVDEQKCSMEAEVDDDDARSWHWIAYASVSSKGDPAPDAADDASGKHGTGQAGGYGQEGRRKSQGGSLPISTVRLVPPPHPPHPAPGSVDGQGGAQLEPPRGFRDVATRMHDGQEAYVRLGRFATLKDYRGFGLGRLLLTTAMDWASKHRETIDRAGSGAADPIGRERIESMGLGGAGETHWRGLCMLHAQRQLVKFYEKYGFELDHELGEWIEEGVVHVAMWKRLDLKRPSVSS